MSIDIHKSIKRARQEWVHQKAEELQQAATLSPEE